MPRETPTAINSAILSARVCEVVINLSPDVQTGSLNGCDRREQCLSGGLAPAPSALPWRPRLLAATAILGAAGSRCLTHLSEAAGSKRDSDVLTRREPCARDRCGLQQLFGRLAKRAGSGFFTR
jgi:hypothetical protein